VAIRAWQLRHDGRFPDRLDELVPEELPSLPVDPYSGKPFNYLPEHPIAQGRLLSSAHNLVYPIRPAPSGPYRIGTRKLKDFAWIALAFASSSLASSDRPVARSSLARPSKTRAT
jgi:hypothetical protein